ncbi:hypothetical protein D3C72_1547770 [compost metagenome]
MVSRNIQLGNGGRITETAIGNDARTAANHQAGHQNIAGRGGAGILAAVHDKHVARRAGFDGDALRMGGIAEFDELVTVFAGRHVAQGEGRADHVLALVAQRAHALDDLVAQAALVKRRRQGSDGNRHQFFARFIVHVCLLAMRECLHISFCGSVRL